VNIRDIQTNLHNPQWCEEHAVALATYAIKKHTEAQAALLPQREIDNMFNLIDDYKKRVETYTQAISVLQKRIKSYEKA